MDSFHVSNTPGQRGLEPVIAAIKLAGDIDFLKLKSICNFRTLQQTKACVYQIQALVMNGTLNSPRLAKIFDRREGFLYRQLGKYQASEKPVRGNPQVALRKVVAQAILTLGRVNIVEVARQVGICEATSRRICTQLKQMSHAGQTKNARLDQLLFAHNPPIAQRHWKLYQLVAELRSNWRRIATASRLPLEQMFLQASELHDELSRTERARHDPVFQTLSQPDDYYWTLEERRHFVALVKERGPDWAAIGRAMGKHENALAAKKNWMRVHLHDPEFSFQLLLREAQREFRGEPQKKRNFVRKFGPRPPRNLKSNWRRDSANETEAIRLARDRRSQQAVERLQRLVRTYRQHCYFIDSAIE